MSDDLVGRVTRAEIATQPECWARAIDDAGAGVAGLPAPGERVLALGCGTSYHVARAYAWLREAAGDGVTDGITASELPPLLRNYDRIVAISRSGTTTEVLEAVRRFAGVPCTALLGEQGTPLADLATDVVDLSYADERSVVQTRFPTTLLMLLRAQLAGTAGLTRLLGAARAALAGPLPAGPPRQLVVLGSGWSTGIAEEAALKCRESAGLWSEAYPGGEYRHGPISVAGPGTLVWSLMPVDEGFRAAVRDTGADLEVAAGDPLVELIRLQRYAVACAQAAGRDPDNPVHLTRSVVLS